MDMDKQEYVVFDFDHTLYPGDCTVDFHLYLLRQKPALLRYLPVQLFYFVCWKLSLVTTDRFKEKYLSFLTPFSPENLQLAIAAFWHSKPDHYLNSPVHELLKQHLQKGDSCVVITASPQWFVSYRVKHLYGIPCIGTLLAYTGRSYRLDGSNCKGKEKVHRFKEAFGTGAVVACAYSDNASDRALFALARTAFRVSGKEIIAVK